MLKLKKFYKSTIASLIPCLCATVALLMSTPTYAAKVDVKVFKEDVEKFDKANIKTILITVPFEGQKVNESDAIADAFAFMPLSIAGYYVVPSAVFEEIGSNLKALQQHLLCYLTDFPLRTVTTAVSKKVLQTACVERANDFSS